MQSLMRANDLLVELRRVSLSLPQEFDLDLVLDRGHENLANLAPGAIATVLLRDETVRPDTDSFLTVRGRGSVDGRVMSTEELPAAARDALGDRRTRQSPLPAGGIAAEALVGAYSALRSRGRVVGLVAVEFRDVDEIDQETIELITGVADALAVGVDNARLLTDVRRRAGDDERRRIARDLHDRTGSTLAAIGFELDRIIGLASAQTGDEIAHHLGTLRLQVTTAIAGLRDTLVDLRSDDSGDGGDDLSVALHDVARRISARSGIIVDTHIDTVRDVPAEVSRQMLIIAREAAINVERHARATTLTVRLAGTEDDITLTVVDDGHGFDPDRVPPDRYGIRGIRERADSIGARVLIDSDGNGTSVTVRWARGGRP